MFLKFKYPPPTVSLYHILKKKLLDYTFSQRIKHGKVKFCPPAGERIFPNILYNIFFQFFQFYFQAVLNFLRTKQIYYANHFYLYPPTKWAFCAKLHVPNMGAAANYNNFWGACAGAEKPNAYSAKIKIIFCEATVLAKEWLCTAVIIIPIFIISARQFKMYITLYACQQLAFYSSVRKCC